MLSAGSAWGGEASADLTATQRLRQINRFFPPTERVFAHRDAILSFLAGYNLVKSSDSVVSVVGGPSFVIASTGETSLSTSGGYFDESRSIGLGGTVGLTIVKPFGRQFGIVVPARLTMAQRGSTEVSRASFTAGAGLVIHVAHGSR